MIKNKTDLKNYITEDCLRYGIDIRKLSLKQYLKFFLDGNPYLKYQICLRKAEYVCNRKKILKYFYIKRLNRLKLKTGIDLGINVAGLGLHIPHGKVVVSSNASIGHNCQIFSDVTIGVDGKGNKKAAIIGDGVRIGSGARIIGDVTIADNVCIGANAVVVNDVLESGATVAGIPAKVIASKG